MANTDLATQMMWLKMLKRALLLVTVLLCAGLSSAIVVVLWLSNSSSVRIDSSVQTEKN